VPFAPFVPYFLRFFVVWQVKPLALVRCNVQPRATSLVAQKATPWSDMPGRAALTKANREVNRESIYVRNTLRNGIAWVRRV
jgi:hypothetical protein